MKRRRRILVAAAALAALPVVIVLAAFAFGVTLDASPWRDAIVARASAALGRTVIVDGPLEVRLRREAELRVGGIRVLNPPGFSASDFATLRDVRVSIDLLALVRGRLAVRGLEGTDVRIRLERAADGASNWSFPTPAIGEPPQASTWRPVAIDMGHIAIRGLSVEFRDARSGTHRTTDVEELSADGGWTEPLSAVARGRLRDAFPYYVAITGGPARLLAEADGVWPFSLEIEVPGARLHTAGSVAVSAREAQFEFGAGTSDLELVEQFLGEKLPKFRVAALSGRVVARPGAIEITDLDGVLDGSRFAGKIAIETLRDRPRMTGEIEFAELDPRPFLRDTASDTRRPFTFDELAENKTALRGLPAVDAAVTVRVRRVAGAGTEVRDATLQLAADERGVRAPVAVTVGDVPFAGRADLDTSGPVPSVAVQLGAHATQLGDLALRLAGVDGIDGGLERLELRAGGRGETVGAVVRDLEARLELARARLSYGNVAGGRPVGFTLDTLVLDAPRGQRLRGSARGTLLGKPATLTFRGRELERILREGGFPVELDIAAHGVSASIRASAADQVAGRPTAVAFRIDAPRSGELAEWLGVARDSQLPMAVRGEARFPQGGWHLHDLRVRIGRSEIAADVRRTVASGRPVTVATIAGPLLDVPELATLSPRATAPATGPRELALDLPILPRGIDLADADLSVRFDRVSLSRADAVDVRFDGRIRGGYLAPSPISATFAGVPFTGLLGLDLRTDVPEAMVAMSAREVNLGALLGSLRLAEDIGAHAESLDIRLVGRGSRLDELIARSSFEARIGGGDFAVGGPASRVAARMRLEDGVVVAPPGQPVEVRLEGSIDDTPVAMRMVGGTLAEFVHDANRVPLAVEARAAGAILRLDGEAELPLGRGGRLRLDLAGERLDSLSALARVRLPPWGPWSIKGPIAMTATGYRLEHLAMRIGESRLTGSGTLDLTGARPKLDMRVKTERIQLDDLPLAPRPDAPPPQPFTVDTLRGYASGAATQTERVLSAAFLRRFDADIDVAVDEVVSGTDRLGDGTLRMELVDGQLHVGLAEVNLPGGTARLSGTYDPVREGVALVVRAHVSRFDYGILARRRWPDSDVEGLFSLNLELTSTARSLNAVLASANGQIDIAVWPKNMGARQVDLWVVNLFRRLLPVIDRGTPSVFNCAVGRFDITGGVLTEDIFVFDTSRTRVNGTGSVDFATEKIDFRFSPRTKRLQLLSLETPVRVTGTLTDFNIGVLPGDVLAAITRFFGSVIVVPLQTLFRGPIPTDGADVCTDPLRLIDTGAR